MENALDDINGHITPTPVTLTQHTLLSHDLTYITVALT